jgi:outer membrane protein TolC
MAVLVLFTSGLSAQTPSGTARPMKLSLKSAIQIALEGNAQIQLAAEGVQLANARAERIHKDLLPDFAAYASVENNALNLAPIGLPANVQINNLHLSDFGSTYNLIQSKMILNQKILDLGLRQRIKASRGGIGVAEAEQDNTKSQIAAQVAKLYLWAGRVDVMVDTAKANVTLAETLLKSTQDRQSTGTGLAVETARAGVQVANARQQLLVAESQRIQTHLNLLKTMNVDLDVALDLTDRLSVPSVNVSSLEQALEDAMKYRADYRAQAHREENARLTYHATELDRLPSIQGVADYGAAGAGISNLRPTHSVGVSLKVPIVDSGRRRAEMAENIIAVRQEEIRTKDLRRQIELEIKLALGAMRNAQLQVSTAQEGLTLAESELAHARQRYDEGVVNSIEITDAQNRIERARDNSTDALFNLNSAQIDLLTATGRIMDLVQ